MTSILADLDTGWGGMGRTETGLVQVISAGAKNVLGNDAITTQSQACPAVRPQLISAKPLTFRPEFRSEGDVS